MAALATIGERFPKTHWLHVYTDGSAAGANHNAGAGVYSRYFSLSRAVGANCTNYDGEVAAVHMALTEVGKREDRNIAIFMDSQAAILAVSSVLPSRNGLVLDCPHMTNSLINNGGNVTLQNKKNEVEMSVLRDTGASLDIGCEKYAAPEMFTGEHALVKHILDDNMRRICIPQS
ncbi:putative rna-directed dna polymerase from transposon bs [Trichonephila clavata]|uniref:Putative rna-directed dna polymerase from transposon bs n=1 Tax=Trichonephila clavata TaxID=2740835 RepID=A0A8X6H572_TRICU|nr:putative rna-directed dna polymerase from transposon bs [Trichonephila clavata]